VTSRFSFRNSERRIIRSVSIYVLCSFKRKFLKFSFITTTYTGSNIIPDILEISNNGRNCSIVIEDYMPYTTFIFDLIRIRLSDQNTTTSWYRIWMFLCNVILRHILYVIVILYVEDQIKEIIRCFWIAVFSQWNKEFPFIRFHFTCGIHTMGSQHNKDMSAYIKMVNNFVL